MSSALAIVRCTSPAASMTASWEGVAPHADLVPAVVGDVHADEKEEPAAEARGNSADAAEPGDGGGAGESDGQGGGADDQAHCAP
ncbi:hypothetical protein [Streptomyces peucetius]|uniref:Uncharacterized protein n=1 Tax=Streptomyces peucetius TaxID=1950 RepID=A0ABY6IA15_STRPE|nr:hypothetical protein [Streptomyces peucetius]UYQ62702.1 hypothetical protein OGH68_15235 [Streptomyces peucetius]